MMDREVIINGLREMQLECRQHRSCDGCALEYICMEINGTDPQDWRLEDGCDG